PERLGVCLWDFSWYTRAGAGEPYADIEQAMAETVARGYNAVRICAAPLLLAGGLGLDALAEALRFEGLGAATVGEVNGQSTRWYDRPGEYVIDVRARFFSFLEAARKQDVVVILASWEYQQSTVFAAHPSWFKANDQVPVNRRHEVL